MSKLIEYLACTILLSLVSYQTYPLICDLVMVDWITLWRSGGMIAIRGALVVVLFGPPWLAMVFVLALCCAVGCHRSTGSKVWPLAFFKKNDLCPPTKNEIHYMVIYWMTQFCLINSPFFVHVWPNLVMAKCAQAMRSLSRKWL